MRPFGARVTQATHDTLTVPGRIVELERKQKALVDLVDALRQQLGAALNMMGLYSEYEPPHEGRWVVKRTARAGTKPRPIQQGRKPGA